MGIRWKLLGKINVSPEVRRGQTNLESLGTSQGQGFRLVSPLIRLWNSAHSYRHGLQQTNTYACCNQEIELVNHLLLPCSFPKLLWWVLFRWAGRECHAGLGTTTQRYGGVACAWTRKGSQRSGHAGHAPPSDRCGRSATPSPQGTSCDRYQIVYKIKVQAAGLMDLGWCCPVG